jgi:hypothetical protein
VELAAAHEHDADLDELARVAAETVGLGIDNDELSRRQPLVKQVQANGDTPHSGRDASGLAATAPKVGVLDPHRKGYPSRHGSNEGVVSMAAMVHDADKLRELDDGERQAWQTYSLRLRNLSGEEYERAESESWSELQRALRQLERRRRTLTQSST